jgi:hypothetical protein
VTKATATAVAVPARERFFDWRTVEVRMAKKGTKKWLSLRNERRRRRQKAEEIRIRLLYKAFLESLR